ncbi:DUF6461 domain-containing protein [Sphaerisporangium perillae]|uniref:DUF6461 domain-containing protein n=1 Tax=Sphaerisporangium perillae TaxID=2935860 RepID=UPI0035576F25
MDDLLHYYRDFLEENWTVNEDTTCFTWFNGCDIQTAASFFGADPRSATPMTYSDARDEACAELQSSSRSNVVLFGTADTWNIAVEPYGWEGSDERVIKAIASDGDALSVLFTAEAIHRITYAHNGERLCVLRPLDERDRPMPQALEEHLDGLLLFGDVINSDWKASALALVQRFTGVRLDHEWLRHRHTRYLIQ